jgi:hypothetical protein
MKIFRRHAPHAAKIGGRRGVCETCGLGLGAPVHLYNLLDPTADDERSSLAMLEQAAQMSAAMRQPGPDISIKSGRMERESPLFFGSGDSPLLW